MPDFVGKENGLKMLLTAIVAQAAYDYESAVRAGAMDARGRVQNPRQRIVKRTNRRSGFIMGHGNSTLAASMTLGDLYDLNRQVTSDKWAGSMQAISGLPIQDAKHFRKLSISRQRNNGTKRFSITEMSTAVKDGTGA